MAQIPVSGLNYHHWEEQIYHLAADFPGLQSAQRGWHPSGGDIAGHLPRAAPIASVSPQIGDPFRGSRNFLPVAAKSILVWPASVRGGPMSPIAWRFAC